MFGGEVPGKHAWDAAGKHIVFVIYQRNGKVLTFPITSRGQSELVSLMAAHAKAGSLYDTDDWQAYTFLNIHGNNVVINKEKAKTKGRNLIHGSEGFLSYAEPWFYHYRGAPKKHFHLVQL